MGLLTRKRTTPGIDDPIDDGYFSLLTLTDRALRDGVSDEVAWDVATEVWDAHRDNRMTGRNMVRMLRAVDEALAARGHA